MTRRLLPVLLLLLLIGRALADEGGDVADGEGDGPSPRALVVRANLGWAHLYDEGTEFGVRDQVKNGGPAASLSVHLRSRYFLWPYLELAYEPLLSTRTAASGEVPARHSSLLGIAASAGAGYSLRSFALWGGLSYNWLRAESDTSEQPSMISAEWHLGFSFALTVSLLRRGPFGLGAGVQARVVTEAEVSHLWGGLWLGYDALTW